MWNSNWWVLLGAVWMGVISTADARAQDRYLEIAARYSRAQVLHEAVVLPDGDRARAFVTFRVPNSLLVFVQDGDGFAADAEISVELFRGGRSVDDGIRRVRHHASTFEETQTRSVDLKAWLPFAVEPGDYTYRLTVVGEAEEGRTVPGEFSVPDFGADGALGSLVFGTLQRDSRQVVLTPAAFGGDVPFGQDVTALVPLVLAESDGAMRADLGTGNADDIPHGMPRFELHRVSPTGLVASARRGRTPPSGARRSPASDAFEIADDGQPVEEGVIAVDRLLTIGGLLHSGEVSIDSDEDLVDSDGRPVESNTGLLESERRLPESERSLPESERSLPESERSFPESERSFPESDPDGIVWRHADAASTHLAVLPIRTDRLESGTYVLKVTRPGGGPGEKYVFSTIWREMPLSLYDVEVAIRHLEYIESRETVRMLLKGSREERIEALAAYWKDRDPTPATVLNELMLEYYRRIDQAALKFRTGRHPFPDGLRTDAARIYVVNGAPEDIVNTLPASGGIEQTWTYADGRSFIFWAANSMAPLELQKGKTAH